MLGPRFRGGREAARRAGEQVQRTRESDERCVKRAKARLDACGWLGRKGSNLRMLESKSSALPLGDAPKLWSGRDHIEGVAGFQRDENAKIVPRTAGNTCAF